MIITVSTGTIAILLITCDTLRTQLRRVCLDNATSSPDKANPEPQTSTVALTDISQEKPRENVSFAYALQQSI
jgi:hypothetical protein